MATDTRPPTDTARPRGIMTPIGIGTTTILIAIHGGMIPLLPVPDDSAPLLAIEPLENRFMANVIVEGPIVQAHSDSTMRVYRGSNVEAHQGSNVYADSGSDVIEPLGAHQCGPMADRTGFISDESHL